MKNRRGSVLIVVLWSIFFLAMLAVAVNSHIRPQLELSGRLTNKMKMYYLARAGIVRAIFEVERDKTKQYDSLCDSWSANDAAFKDVPLGPGTFSAVKGPEDPGQGTQYGLTDEESRININKAPQYVLKNLFEKEAGVESTEAGAIADSILDWRDEDDSLHKDGKEKSYYQSLGEPYPCKNGDFEAPEELLLVGGMTRNIFDKVKDMITIYGDGTVNVNTAGVRVLAALGMDKSAAEKIVNFRLRRNSRAEKEAPDNVFTDASSIADVLSKAERLDGDESGQLARAAAMLGVKSDNFRGVITGTLPQEGRGQSIAFVYDRKNKTVKYWREE